MDRNVPALFRSFQPLSLREREILELLSQNLSDHEIADRLFIARTTVKWYNRQIYNKLGVDNRKEAVACAVRLRLLEQPLAKETPASSLPIQRTPFVGRLEELTKIAALLNAANCRLLTLVGAGGVGKTRLAVQAANVQPPNFTDGVWFVPLTAVRSADLLASAIAGALHITLHSPNDPNLQLLQYLRDKEILLVLDNFEHLLEGVTLLSDVLASCRAVKVLVTSRERLHLQEEWVLTLEGLAFPSSQLAEPLETYSAVQLFVQRAQQVQDKFSLLENADFVATICQHVAGLPLALELASTWLRVMPCKKIAEQIVNSLELLTTPLRDVPERHRSVRAVFEQSWKLLSNGERDALMRLSVFQGGCDLEAAQQVAQAPLSLLAGVVDKSLVQVNADGRCHLHELLRQFLTEKVSEAGQTHSLAEAHLRYFLKLAEQAETHLWGRGQSFWYDRLETELDNLRAALRWSFEGKAFESGLRLAAALGWFFAERSHVHEGFTWLTRLLSVNDEAPVILRGKALNCLPELASALGNRKVVTLYTEQALALAHESKDDWTIAWAYAHRGYWMGESYNRDENIVMLNESLARFRKLDDAMGVNHVLRRLAQTVYEAGDYPYARALLEEALIAARVVDDGNAAAQSLLYLGLVDWIQDHNVAQAASRFESSLASFQAVGNRLTGVWAMTHLGLAERAIGNEAHAQALFEEVLMIVQDLSPNHGSIAMNCTGLASIARSHGDFVRAAVLFGFSENDAMSDQPHDPYRVNFERDVAQLREQMDELSFDRAWSQGKTLTREQALRYALKKEKVESEILQTGHARISATSIQPLIEPLSKRELEILQLVADGHSNRAIAEHFVIAVGTVKWYLNLINNKLGVTSRTQAVARVRDLGLFT